MPEIKAPATRAFRLTSGFYGAKEGDTVYYYSHAMENGAVADILIVYEATWKDK